MMLSTGLVPPHLHNLLPLPHSHHKGTGGAAAASKHDQMIQMPQAQLPYSLCPNGCSIHFISQTCPMHRDNTRPLGTGTSTSSISPSNPFSIESILSGRAGKDNHGKIMTGKEVENNRLECESKEEGSELGNTFKIQSGLCEKPIRMLKAEVGFLPKHQRDRNHEHSGNPAGDIISRPLYVSTGSSTMPTQQSISREHSPSVNRDVISSYRVASSSDETVNPKLETTGKLTPTESKMLGHEHSNTPFQGPTRPIPLRMNPRRKSEQGNAESINSLTESNSDGSSCGSSHINTGNQGNSNPGSPTMSTSMGHNLGFLATSPPPGMLPRLNPLLDPTAALLGSMYQGSPTLGSYPPFYSQPVGTSLFSPYARPEIHPVERSLGSIYGRCKYQQLHMLF